MEKNTISIITPCINNAFNIKISNDNTKGRIIRYTNDNTYIITSKDCSRPDIVLDETMVELLLKAKTTRDDMIKHISCMKTSELYNPDMYNDLRLITQMLRLIEKEQRCTINA